MANNATKFLQVIQGESSIRFVLGNGKELVCEPDKADAVIQRAAMFHGFNQKVRDAAAGFSKDGDYAGAYAAMGNVLETLQSGLWNAKGGASGESDLAQAVANLKKIDLEKASAAVRALDEDQLRALRGKASVKAELLRIKAERAARVADAAEDDEEDILGGL
jgi:antitoxin component of MazEF toxin-antitoxin module